MQDKFGRLFHMPINLAKKNIRTVVFSANYKKSRPEVIIHNGVKFISYPMRWLSVIKFIFNFYLEVRANKADVIIASGDSHFGFLGLIVAKRLKVPFVFDVYDYYPAFMSNKLPGMKFMYKLALKHADAVTCVSENLYRHIKEYNDTVLRIENGIDPADFHPMDRDECRASLGIKKEEVVIGYFGSMEAMRGIETLLDACKLLIDRYNIKLRLLLAGAKPDSLNLGYVWVDYRGIRMQKEIATMINASSVVVLPYNNDSQIHYSNSCKIAEYFACRVPIVSTKVPDFVTNYPEETQSLNGAICEPANPSLMCDAIYYQLLNQKIVIPKSALTWSALTEKLLDALIQLQTRR